MALKMVIKIDGVEGESKVKDHEGEIDVLEWDWGMVNTGSMHVGGGGGTGVAEVHDLTFKKQVDKASATLYQRCCKGTHITEGATLFMRKMGDDPLDFMKIKMSPVLVSSIDSGGSEGDESFTETIGLNFGNVEITYTPQKEDGSPDADIVVTWNIEAGTT